MRAPSRTPSAKRLKSAPAGNLVVANPLMQASSKMRDISASSMGCRALGILRPHCFANAVRYCVRGREQHWICGSGVPGRDGARLVTEQRRNCEVAIAEVGSDAGKGMSKHVR